MRLYLTSPNGLLGRSRDRVLIVLMVLIVWLQLNVEARQLHDDGGALLREAVALLKAGKVDEAEPLLRRTIALTPSNSDAHNLLGVVLDQRGNAAEAETEYRAALRSNPDSISARANLGVLLA